ncbi:MAG TPA: hypothetical protein VF713_12500 [Thermoanaerobaculia bacterium]
MAEPEDPVLAVIDDVVTRVVDDFEILSYPEHEQEAALDKIAGWIFRLAAIDLVAALPPSDQSAAEHIASESPKEGIRQFLQYALPRVPRWPLIVDEAFERVRELVIGKAQSKETKTAIETAEKYEDAADDLADLLEELNESNPGSAVISAIKLLFDPARGLRDTKERQAHFFRKASIIVVNTITTIWTTILIVVTADTLTRRFGIHIGALERMPQWLHDATLTGEWRNVAYTTAAAALLAILVIVVFAAAGHSTALHSLFHNAVAEEELASHHIALRSTEVLDLKSARVLRDSVGLVYREVLSRSGAGKKKRLLLDELLTQNDERRVVVFVRSSVRQYRKVLRDCVDSVCRRIEKVMGAIGSTRTH